MITAAAVCPHPPLLFRELTGQHDIVADLRAACVSAIRSTTAAAPDRVVVVGGADATGIWDSRLGPDVRRFGTTGRRSSSGLPLSLGVGKRLLEEAGWAGPVELSGIGWDAPAPDIEKVADALVSCEERITLLVLGDGSTRRGDKAPGYLDDRAFPFDEATGRALETGDFGALLEMDSGLAHELMVSGRAAFQVLAAVAAKLGSRPRASMAYRADPYGVTYYVAVWEM